MDAQEIANAGPDLGTAAWRFTAREGGAHFLLADNADNYTCTLLVSRVEGKALRQGINDMLAAWSNCCNIKNRAVNENDKHVRGLTAHYTDWIVQIPSYPYGYVVGLSTIETENAAWHAILTFNPTRTPF